MRVAESVAQAVHGDAREPAALSAAQPAEGHRVELRPEEVAAARKADVLRACDETARGAGDAVTQVTATYAEIRRQVEVFNSDGLAASDDVIALRLFVAFR